MPAKAPSPAAHHPDLSVGWGRQRLRRRSLSAAIAAVVGVFATAAGAGLGIRHLIKTGVTWTSVLGLALLVIGLILLAFAVTVFWRTTHRWQRLWLLPAAIVALVVVWSVALGVMFTYAPRDALGTATPTDRGLIYTNVTLVTVDGVRLSAWYIPATNRAAVVLMPGAGSTRTATLGQAAVLARHGYGALMVDPRGQGRSGGRAMDIGWPGERDLTAAVSFLQHQPGVDPNRIAVLGLSMGGEAAIGAAAADNAIRAVVAEGATARTAADKDGWLPGGFAGALQRGLDWLSYATTNLLSSAPQPISLHDAIARAKGTPFLLITAGKVDDESLAATYFRTAAPQRVQVWNVGGASHTQGLNTQPGQWTARVTSFLDQALAVTTH